MPNESIEQVAQQPQQQLQAHVVELQCSNGTTYNKDNYVISAFGQNSFLVERREQSKGAPRRFLILPTRVVEAIIMEEGAAAHEHE